MPRFPQNRYTTLLLPSTEFQLRKLRGSRISPTAWAVRRTAVSNFMRKESAGKLCSVVSTARAKFTWPTWNFGDGTSRGQWRWANGKPGLHAGLLVRVLFT